jgi:hypothetical protein
MSPEFERRCYRPWCVDREEVTQEETTCTKKMRDFIRARPGQIEHFFDHDERRREAMQRMETTAIRRVQVTIAEEETADRPDKVGRHRRGKRLHTVMRGLGGWGGCVCVCDRGEAG